MSDSSEDRSRFDQGMSELAFVRLLTAEQGRLLRYVTMLLGDPEAAHNVVQETNIVLWKKACDFEPGSNFSAWARKVAYWQVMAYVRDQKRDFHVFDDELIGQLAELRNRQDDDVERRVALRDCLNRLDKENASVLRQKYDDGLSVIEIANKIGKSKSAVKMMLVRVRRLLLACVEANLSNP